MKKKHQISPRHEGSLERCRAGEETMYEISRELETNVDAALEQMKAEQQKTHSSLPSSFLSLPYSSILSLHKAAWRKLCRV